MANPAPANQNEIKIRREYLKQIANYAIFDKELGCQCLSMPEGEMDQLYDDLILLPDNILKYRVSENEQG